MPTNKTRLKPTGKALRNFIVFSFVCLLANHEAVAQNFWQQTNGPYGGTIQALAVNPATQDIFAGTNGGGVFRSTNNGDSWMAVNTGLTNTFVFALAINASGHLFAGTSAGGVFRSTNNGDSWMAVNTGLTSTNIRALTINASGHIFVGTSGGVFRSTNNGDSWMAVNTGLTRTVVRALAINSSGHIFAGTEGGVFRSTNNGDSWTAVNTGLTSTFVFALAINSSGHIFAGTDAGGVFRSTNNGDSWMATGLTNTDGDALAINSSGHIFAGTDDGVFRSTNNGDSWMAVNTGLTRTVVRALAINSSGHIFAGTSGGGVFRSAETTGAAPTAITNSATNITATSAMLNGTVNPNNLSTTVKFEFGTTTSYGSEIAVTPSSVSGTSAMAVSAMLTGLVPNTLYHYRVVGTNSAGTTNGADQTFTTPGLAPTVTTNAATNSGSTSATFNATVNPNNATAVVKFQYGTTTSYGSEISATQSPVSGASAVPVSAVVTGLIPNTLYHFRIVATNSIGASNGADQTFATSANQPPVVTLNSLPPQPNGQAIQVQASITDDRPGVNATVNFRRGGDSGFGTAPMNGSGTVFVGAIPPVSVTSRGVEFFIMAMDADNAQTRQPATGFVSIQIQVTSEAKPTPQPSGSTATAYRLISMPLQLDNPSATAVLEDDLGPYDDKKWRLFGLDPTASQNPDNKTPYVELRSSGDLSAGKSLFLIVADPGKTITIGPARSLRTDQEFQITLQRGHNFIGTPFNFTIPANKLRLQSGGAVTLRTFNGSFSPATEMQPGEGYYVANLNQTSDILLINPNLFASAANKTTAGSWRLRILASCAEARDDYNFAGVAPESEDGCDDNDLAEPPPIGDYVSLYFSHPEWQKALSRFSDDIRQAANSNQQWRFKVATNIPHEIVALQFAGLEEIDPGLSIFVVDEALKFKQNLRENSVYQYQPHSVDRPNEFTLIVGKADFVSQQTAGAQGVPEDFVLEQNFPNPFRIGGAYLLQSEARTMIRFGLPEQSVVTIKIFDLAGREVATLLEKADIPPGLHQRGWDGRDVSGRVVPNGIYFYRLVAGNVVRTMKMIVIR